MTKDDVEHIAALSRLRFDESETNSMIQDMRGILRYIACLERLDEVREQDAQTGAGPPGSAALRDDSARTELDAEEALAPAPDSSEGHFRVPKVI